MAGFGARRGTSDARALLAPRGDAPNCGAIDMNSDAWDERFIHWKGLRRGLHERAVLTAEKEGGVARDGRVGLSHARDWAASTLETGCGDERSVRSSRRRRTRPTASGVRARDRAWSAASTSQSRARGVSTTPSGTIRSQGGRHTHTAAPHALTSGARCRRSGSPKRIWQSVRQGRRPVARHPSNCTS